MTYDELIEGLRRAGWLVGAFAQDEETERIVEFALDWFGANENDVREYLGEFDEQEIT